MNERRLLPPDQRVLKIEVQSDGTLLLFAGFHERDGCVLWNAMPFSDFSQTLTCLDDLECFVIDKVDRESG